MHMFWDIFLIIFLVDLKELNIFLGQQDREEKVRELSGVNMNGERGEGMDKEQRRTER